MTLPPLNIESGRYLQYLLKCKQWMELNKLQVKSSKILISDVYVFWQSDFHKIKNIISE